MQAPLCRRRKPGTNLTLRLTEGKLGSQEQAPGVCLRAFYKEVRRGSTRNRERPGCGQGSSEVACDPARCAGVAGRAAAEGEFAAEEGADAGGRGRAQIAAVGEDSLGCVRLDLVALVASRIVPCVLRGVVRRVPDGDLPVGRRAGDVKHGHSVAHVGLELGRKAGGEPRPVKPGAQAPPDHGSEAAMARPQLERTAEGPDDPPPAYRTPRNAATPRAAAGAEPQFDQAPLPEPGAEAAAAEAARGPQADVVRPPDVQLHRAK